MKMPSQCWQWQYYESACSDIPSLIERDFKIFLGESEIKACFWRPPFKSVHLIPGCNQGWAKCVRPERAGDYQSVISSCLPTPGASLSSSSLSISVLVNICIEGITCDICDQPSPPNSLSSSSSSISVLVHIEGMTSNACDHLLPPNKPLSHHRP